MATKILKFLDPGQAVPGFRDYKTIQVLNCDIFLKV